MDGIAALVSLVMLAMFAAIVAGFSKPRRQSGKTEQRVARGFVRTRRQSWQGAAWVPKVAGIVWGVIIAVFLFLSSGGMVQ